MALNLITRLNLSSQQINVLVSISLACLVFAIGYRGIYSLKALEVDRLRTETAALEEKLEVIESVNAHNEEVQELLDRLGDFGNVSALVAQINQMANELNITVNRIEPKPVRVEKYVEIQPVQISMECPYHSLGFFISLIESSGLYLKVEKVNISASGGDAGSQTGARDQRLDLSSESMSTALVTIAGIRAIE